MKLAVFDVCGTLYDANTTHDFVAWHLRRTSRHRHLVFRLLRIRPLLPIWMLLNLLLRRDVFRLFAVRLLRGADSQALHAGAREFVDGYLVPRTRRSVLALMRELESRGYIIVLASASLEPVVEQIAGALQIGSFVSSTLDVRMDRLTGRYARDTAGRKHALIAERYPGCSEFAVITDNLNDADLVRAASQCWIVCAPEKRVRWRRLLPGDAVFLE